MSLAKLPTQKQPLSLSAFKNIADKLKHIYDYLKIDEVFFEIKNPQDFEIPQPKDFLYCIKMYLSGGTASYIKSKLNECLEVLKEDLQKYLQGDDDFETISENLKSCIELSKRASRENDRLNRLGFNEQIEFYVNVESQWERVLFDFLKLDRTIVFDWDEHFDIRKNFYEELNEEFSNALNWHKEKPELSKKPYEWDSKNATLQISELLYLLYEKAEMIKINKESGGSFPKFRREFFGLFGLSDNRYAANVSDILKRKKDQHFIDWLAGQLPKTAP